MLKKLPFFILLCLFFISCSSSVKKPLVTDLDKALYSYDVKAAKRAFLKAEEEKDYSLAGILAWLYGFSPKERKRPKIFTRF